MDNKQEFVRWDEKKQLAMAERVRESRVKANISMKDMAKILNVDYKHWAKLEKGKYPIKETYLYMLPQILGVTIDYLMYGNEKTDMTKKHFHNNQKVTDDKLGEIIELIEKFGIEELEDVETLLRITFKNRSI